MKKKKKLLTIFGVCIALFLVLCIMIILPIRDYHDKNTWATFLITGDGIAEGQTRYDCTPDRNVIDYGNGTKGDGKGETILLGFASFEIARVDIGKEESVVITSEQDLLYGEQTVHRVYLRSGDRCDLKGSGKSAVITLVDVGYR